ncbi:FG-GAP-like repeat-containing protein [Sandaracinus amylolyticus]|uniref:FG-GAP-like repeat-containing protein n=1 Tax=Sandaracinus amylolyticus TaxID=927083 RepID=UPI001F1E62BC|nr:FG-GAP-like repeat-containing protein [Sandaracinus amylolyticus]
MSPDDASTARPDGGALSVFVPPSVSSDPDAVRVLPASLADAGVDAARVSPPECPVAGDPAFCEDCYRWEDGGPDSLGRNVDGEAFGQLSSGDLNEDGYPDFAVGVPLAREHEEHGGLGEIFVYLGSAHGFMPLRRVWTETPIQGLGLMTSVADVDGDEHDDIVATYASDGGGIAVFFGSGTGELSEPMLVAASDISDPDGSPLDVSIDASALVTADFDRDGSAEIVLGAPAWHGTGAVLVLRGGGTSVEWLTHADVGGTGSFERFGTSLAAFTSDGLDRPLLLVGAPESAMVHAFYDGSGELSPLGTLSSLVGAQQFGRSMIAGRGLIAVGTSSGVVELFGGSSSGYLEYGELATIRPLAIADTNGDDFVELFGVEDRELSSTTGKLFAWFGVEADLTTHAARLSPDAAPPRVPNDALGFQTAVGDWDGDGLDDVAFGAPAIFGASPGQVFGYHGAAEPRAEEDNTFDFDDSYFRLDQETPACDRCRALSLPDGAACVTGLCVDLACTPLTGCGDGWPEVGPDPAREGCDDRNLESGDSCSSTCQPTPFVVAARDGEIDEPTGDRAVALDERGAALVVWTAQVGTATELRARRYTRYGSESAASEDESPIVIARIPGPGWDLQPAVAGRGGEWVVVWRQPVGAEVSAIVMRTVALDGALGVAVRVSGEDEVASGSPSVAAPIDGSRVVAWTDATNPATPRVRYRWSSADGTTMDSIVTVGPGSDPAVAASDSGIALVAWAEPAALGARSRLVGLRASRTGPRDAAPFEIAGDGASPSVACEHDFIVSWVGRALDPEGDIYVRRIGLWLDPALSAATRVTQRDERGRAHAELRPSVAARGNGWIVAWDEPTERRARLASDVALPPEYATLDAALSDGLQRSISLAGGERGTWVIWSDARTDLTPSSPRSTRGFLLRPN